MASACGYAYFVDLGLTLSASSSSSNQRHQLFCRRLSIYSSLDYNNPNGQSPRLSVAPRKKGTREIRLFRSGGIELNRFLTSDNEDEMSEGFFEAIEELERMAREPADVLVEMNDKLSIRELQLVLVYFSQEGRDSWCALEVFDWLRKENRVDKETMELMVSIMCGWVQKLINGEHDVADVVDLLVDMDCVGLKPGFSMIEKVISLYWEMGEKERAIAFVEKALKRGISFVDDDDEGHKGGPTGYLAWKMMVSIC